MTAIKTANKYAHEYNRKNIVVELELRNETAIAHSSVMRQVLYALAWY